MCAARSKSQTEATDSRRWPRPTQVVVVDISQPRIDAWNSSKLPIYEPRLDEVVFAARCVHRHLSRGALSTCRPSLGRRHRCTAPRHSRPART